MREAILSDVSEIQSQLRIEAGALYQRGIHSAYVLRSGDDRIVWLDEFGEKSEAPLTEFRSVKCRRISPAGSSIPFMTFAWTIASARFLETTVRITTLSRLLKRATPEEKVRLRRWSASLSQNMEPTR